MHSSSKISQQNIPKIKQNNFELLTGPDLSKTEPLTVSSQSLKDIVPDIKPYLEDLNDVGVLERGSPSPGGSADYEGKDQIIMEIEEAHQDPTSPTPTNHEQKVRGIFVSFR